MSNEATDSPLPSDSFYPNTAIVQDISNLIERNEFDEALRHLTRSLTAQQIYDSTWDLSTYLFHLAEQPSDKLCNEHELFAQDALLHVAQHGNPREMLIIMLEQSDRFISDQAYSFHMKLSMIIIQRLPLKPSIVSSIRDILTLLKCHLTTQPLPTITNEFEGKDLLVYNHDRRVVHLLDLTRAYVEFLGQLRDYFATTPMSSVVGSLSKYLVSLLHEPLSSLSYEPINGQESSSMVSIRPLLNCLFTLAPNPIQIIGQHEHEQSVLIYLLLTKEPYFSLLPRVYSAQFYLFLSISSIQQLGEHRDQVLLTEKACALVSAVCSRLTPHKEFDHTMLDHDQMHSLIDTLKMLMVQSPARQYAPLTIGAYRALFQAFDSLGRYHFLRQQLTKTAHSEDSYRTFLCTLLKEEFLQDYRTGSSDIYKGSSLFHILDPLCRLPNGVESDLLEIYDSLCSSLNFVRFIGLIDKQAINRTLFWTDRLSHVNETFLKPLRKSIDIARAHYRLEIKNQFENRHKQHDEQRLAEKPEILIDDKPVSMPNRKEQLETLHSAVTKFDILDCILGSLADTFGDSI